MESQFEEINTDYTDDNGVTHLDGFKPNQDEGCVVGYIFNKEVYYTNPDFRNDALVVSTIKDLKEENLIN